MKKSFNSWKLLTLLSSLIFAMSCWYLVYAAGGFDNWKVPGGIWNELSSTEWNDLMDNLWVPSWAVMAFNLSSCPDWWTEYTAARDRTIRGKGYYNSAGDTGGSDNIYLSEYQLPAHSHYMVARWAKNSSQYVYDHDWMNYPNLPLAYEDDHDDSGSDGNFSYTLAAYPGTATLWKTSTAWYWWGVDIRNSYVMLLFCQKN